MANIIENTKKVKRILHRFDTAENWKNSTIKLLPGELAFDDKGNFKVGLSDRPQGTLWEDLPFAGKSKFISGTADEIPSISKNDSYTPGDMFKDTTTNKWYFLTGFDAYGEYVWEELTFGSHDIESSIDNLQEELSQKVDASKFEEELDKKVNVSQLEDAIAEMATKNEILAVADLVDEHDDKLASLEDSVIDALSKLEEKAGGEELESLASNLMEYTNTEVGVINSKLAEKASRDELDRAIASLEEKHDLELSTLDVSVDERLASKVSTEELSALEGKLTAGLSTKVDVSTLFDESGSIRSSLLPGSVDDIVEGVFIADTTFMPLDGNSQVGVGGKLYLDVNTKTLYRWSGSQYVSISSGTSNLILGTTDGTAYEGSAGKRLEGRVSTIEDSLSKMSSKVEEQGTKISSIENTVSKQSETIETLRTNVSSLTTSVSEHERSILTLQVKTDSYDGKITDVQNSIKDHSTALSNVDKKITSIEEKNAAQDSSLSNLTKEVAKIAVFEKDLENLDDKITSTEDEIATLEVTTSAIAKQVDSLSNVGTKVENLTTEVNTIKNTVDTHTTKFVEQDSKITILDSEAKTQKTTLDALSSTVNSHTTSLAEQANKIASLEVQKDVVSNISAQLTSQTSKISALETKSIEQGTALTALSDSVKAQQTQIDYLKGNADRITVLEQSDAQQKEDIKGIENLIYTQTQEIATVKADISNQNSKLSNIEEKIDNILSLETPEGTMSFGKLAFKDKVMNADIEGVSVTKLTQAEDEEIEFWCGDSRF